MSALDLDALEARCKDTIAEWTLVYAQSGDTLPDDAVETKAARETLALITRLRAAEARTAWQPIETVPRDGQRVTLYVVSPHWRRPELGLWHRGPEGTGWHQDAERSKLTRGTPTHWMPLPAAPEAP